MDKPCSIWMINQPMIASTNCPKKPSQWSWSLVHGVRTSRWVLEQKPVHPSLHFRLLHLLRHGKRWSSCSSPNCCASSGRDHCMSLQVAIFSLYQLEKSWCAAHGCPEELNWTAPIFSWQLWQPQHQGTSVRSRELLLKLLWRFCDNKDVLIYANEVMVLLPFTLTYSRHTHIFTYIYICNTHLSCCYIIMTIRIKLKSFSHSAKVILFGRHLLSQNLLLEYAPISEHG